jgi:hypothetical protein
MISKITDYIIERFEEDEMVHTISLSPIDLIDTKKENIYPLVAIRFNAKTADDDVLLYDYTIHILKQRDSNRKVKPSKIMEESNWIDNLNECDSIAMKFINYIRRFDINSNITINTISELEPLSEFGGANLDGFVFDIVLSSPNTGYCGI